MQHETNCAVAAVAPLCCLVYQVCCNRSMPVSVVVALLLSICSCRHSFIVSQFLCFTCTSLRSADHELGHFGLLICSLTAVKTRLWSICSDHVINNFFPKYISLHNRTYTNRPSDNTRRPASIFIPA